MQSPPPLPGMKRRLILCLSLLGALLSTSCASPARTALAPIPVDPALRAACPPALQPADPVTASAALRFGYDAAVEARCWRAVAAGALATIDRHNASAESNGRGPE